MARAAAVADGMTAPDDPGPKPTPVRIVGAPPFTVRITDAVGLGCGLGIGFWLAGVLIVGLAFLIFASVIGGALFGVDTSQ